MAKNKIDEWFLKGKWFPGQMILMGIYAIGSIIFIIVALPFQIIFGIFSSNKKKEK